MGDRWTAEAPHGEDYLALIDDEIEATLRSLRAEYVAALAATAP